MSEVIVREDYITLKISKGKFNFLINTIKSFSDNIYSWGFDKFFEKRLLEDLKSIRNVLENKTNGEVI